MNWPVVRFEDLYLEPSRNGIYKRRQFHGSGVRIVNMGELFTYDVIDKQDMSRLMVTDSEMDRFGLADGDLLFGRRSLVDAGAGKCSIVEKLSEPTTFESSIIRVRIDQVRVQPRFLYYWFKSRRGRGEIRSIVTGTNIKGIKGSTLKNIKVPCPSIEAQNFVVKKLQAYDDSIENNRRRIQLLERAARLLYREWFVHLRFPGHEHARVTNDLLEGWKTLPLSEICFDVRESVDPRTIQSNTAYIGLEHMPRRSITLHEWTDAAGIESNKFKFSEGDILFGKIRPYFHKTGFALVDGITSSDAIVIRPREGGLYYFLLLLLSSDEFISLASKTMREGSKMPRADWKYLLGLEFRIPPPALLDRFNTTVMPICSQLRSLALRNRQLARARDLLLPRLMNGEMAA